MRKYIKLILLTCILATSLPFIAFAQCCNGCRDCSSTSSDVQSEQTSRIKRLHREFVNDFTDYREWWVNTFLSQHVTNDIQLVAQRLTYSGFKAIYDIGKLFDAKQQLETERYINELRFEAQRDYQPDEDICTFGTITKSMANAEGQASITTLTLNERQMARHLGNRNVGGSADKIKDKQNRWQHYVNHYCDPNDNNWLEGVNATGLTVVCGNANGEDDENFGDRTNIDINYGRLIENRRIINVDGGTWLAEGDELDVMSLGNNLYGHDLINRKMSQQNISNIDLAQIYMEYRSILAKRNVAESSYNTIVGLHGMVFSTNDSFLGPIFTNLGIPEDEVTAYLGLDPNRSGTGILNGSVPMSYYGLLEILGKKIYQNPAFFANLYETEANVKRKGAALKAFEIMLDRAIHESQLRQEMAMSVLLSSRLKKYADEANKNMGSKE